MTPGRVLFVGLLVVAGALFLLNPGEDKFQEFVADEIATQISGEGGGIGGIVARRLGRAASGLARDFVRREDYYLWSIYTADLNGRAPDGEWRFLGIAGTFITLDRPMDDDE